MLQIGEPYKSEMSKTNSKLAKKCDDDQEWKNEFFYWLGYWNGQDSVLNEEN